MHYFVNSCSARALGGMVMGNGQQIVSETDRTIHKCRFLGQAIVNVLIVHLAHPAINIRHERIEII